VLQFILEPPEKEFEIDYSKLSAEKMGATSNDTEDYGQGMVNKMARSMVNYMLGKTLLNDPFSDPFEPVMEVENMRESAILPLTASMDDVTGGMRPNGDTGLVRTSSLRLMDPHGDAMYGEAGDLEVAFVNDMSMVPETELRDPNNPFLFQGQTQSDLVKKKQREEADVLVFRALAKMLLSRSIAAHKQMLAFQYNIAVDIFNVLDTQRLGIIDFFDIQRFLRSHCHISVTEDDLTFLRINKVGLSLSLSHTFYLLFNPVRSFLPILSHMLQIKYIDIYVFTATSYSKHARGGAQDCHFHRCISST
jgi:hypothetical protein